MYLKFLIKFLQCLKLARLGVTDTHFQLRYADYNFQAMY